jgi:hypothetical protein
MRVNGAGPMLTFTLGDKFILVIHGNYRFHNILLPCHEGNHDGFSGSSSGVLVA